MHTNAHKFQEVICGKRCCIMLTYLAWIPSWKEVHYQPVYLSVYIFRMFTSFFLHRLLACDYFWHIYSSLPLNDQIFVRFRETELKRSQFNDTWSVEVFCWFPWHMTLDKWAESDRITLIQTSARLPSAFSTALQSHKHTHPQDYTVVQLHSHISIFDTSSILDFTEVEKWSIH